MAVEGIRPFWIDTAQAVESFCAKAAGSGRVAVDTEADSFHSYHHKLCLIQLSVNGENALVDPLDLGREGLAPLGALLSNGRVTKLFHGADYDLRLLDRDLGFRVCNIRDTQLAAQFLGEPATGLAALVANELGVRLDKKYQRADWGRRPLSEEERAYAAADTAFLAPLSDRLQTRLFEQGRSDWWIEECQALEEVRWTPAEPDPLGFQRIKGAKALRGAARDRLAALHVWREGRASAADVPTFRIIRNEVLLALAVDPPEDLRSLGRIRGMPRSVLRDAGRELVALLASPPPAPQPAASQPRRPDREVEARAKELRQARDRVASELQLPPGLVAPRWILDGVAAVGRIERRRLGELLGRRWRARLLVGPFHEVIASWPAASANPDAADQ